MRHPTAWNLTFYGPEGSEVAGWYNGSEREARAWAEREAAKMGALRFEIVRAAR